jgi:hypothetical protein
MIRRLSVLLALCSVSWSFFFNDTATTEIYTALYNIRYSDVPQWTEDYYQHSVPVLEAMVSEGILNNFNVRMHHTGGEYTIRQGFIAGPETNYQTVWDTYLGRLAEADAAAFERGNRMILAHADEIWNLSVLNIPDGADTRYMYSAMFRINFADMAAWNQAWADEVFPGLDQAMADGLLQGYVVQEHNTGGQYNWKIVYLYDEWDNLDEVEARIFGAVPLDHPLWAMFTAHRDELWQELAPPS